MIGSLVFVVPTYRTADTLPGLLDRIAATAPTVALRHEVVVVDDACPQDSGQLVADRTDVRVFRLDENCGQRTAVLSGMAVASADVFCVIDADLQDDPAAVPSMIDHLTSRGCDVVSAGRRGEHQSRVRRGQAWAFRRVRWAATRGAVPADAGLFHVARGVAVRRMLADAAPGSDPMVVYARTGADIVSVPIERLPRPLGSSSYTTAARAAMAAATVRTVVGSQPTGATWPTMHRIVTAERP